MPLQSALLTGDGSMHNQPHQSVRVRHADGSVGQPCCALLSVPARFRAWLINPSLRYSYISQLFNINIILIYDLLVSLIISFDSCIEAGYRFTTCFFFLSSLLFSTSIFNLFTTSSLLSTSTFNMLTTCYYTCSKQFSHLLACWGDCTSIKSLL